MSEQIKVMFLSANRAPKCPSDPNYPDGMIVDGTMGAPGCWVDVPYPAVCCGQWLIECPVCDNRVTVTAAGRPDDAKRVKIPCKIEASI